MLSGNSICAAEFISIPLRNSLFVCPGYRQCIPVIFRNIFKNILIGNIGFFGICIQHRHKFSSGKFIVGTEDVLLFSGHDFILIHLYNERILPFCRSDIFKSCFYDHPNRCLQFIISYCSACNSSCSLLLTSDFPHRVYYHCITFRHFPFIQIVIFRCFFHTVIQHLELLFLTYSEFHIFFTQTDVILFDISITGECFNTEISSIFFSDIHPVSVTCVVKKALIFSGIRGICRIIPYIASLNNKYRGAFLYFYHHRKCLSGIQFDSFRQLYGIISLIECLSRQRFIQLCYSTRRIECIIQICIDLNAILCISTRHLEAYRL